MPDCGGFAAFGTYVGTGTLRIRYGLQLFIEILCVAQNAGLFVIKRLSTRSAEY
jgi:hypothetical protein